MPRYFFHVLDNRNITDNTGTVLPHLRYVRAEAIRAAGAILRDEGDRFWNSAEWPMNVTDAAGQSMLKFRFSIDKPGFAPDQE